MKRKKGREGKQIAERKENKYVRKEINERREKKLN